MSISLRTRYILLTATLCMIFVGLLTGLFAYHYVHPFYLRAQNYDMGRIAEFHVTTVFQDRLGSEIGRLYVEERTLLTHEEIPDLMRSATLAVEDKRFYTHHGFDPKSMLRALYTNIRSGKHSEGASTITQQLAKNVDGNFSKTVDRKMAEFFVALRIEKQLTKDEILDHYLNRIYFGKGSFGLSAAARKYFGKEAMDLTLGECALLAGIIKAPNTYSPRNNPDLALRQRNRVLVRMQEQGLIDAQQAVTVLNSPVTLTPESNLRMQSYFMALALQEMRGIMNVNENEDIPQGLVIHTTMDSTMQHTVESRIRQKLEDLDTSPDAPPTAEDQILQAAAVILDLQSGAVRALVGGRDFESSPFDRARMARRENGALLQPFLYALAFEKLQLHPASMVNASFLADTDSEVETELGDSRTDLGPRFLMIQDALALSNKATATRVSQEMGVNTFRQWLAQTGLDAVSPPTADTPWNADPLTLLEITSLYQMLGNEGKKVSPYVIESVVSPHGEILYEASLQPGTPMLDPITARQMTLTLQAAARDGTAHVLSFDHVIPQPMAAMTGYSVGYRDSWLVGFTPALALGVWVGFDESIPIGSKSFATRTALPIWGDIMQSIHAVEPRGVAFPVPPELVKLEADRRTGVIRGLGFLSPGAHHIFVHLRQNQFNEKDSGPAATHVRQPGDWLDWLATMYADPAGDDPSLNPSAVTRPDPAAEIPSLTRYRLPALRGDILTSDGATLATMTQVQSLVLTWPAMEVAPTNADALIQIREKMLIARKWLPADTNLTDADLLLLYRFRRFQPVTVVDRLTPGQVRAFHASPLKKEGFSLQGYPLRTYPRGRELSHLLGYLQRSQGKGRAIHQADEVIYDEYHGAAGLEEYFDQQLRGADGQVTIRTNFEGFARDAAVQDQATAGAQLRTTIDSRLQTIAERAFDNIPTGGLVILDVRNGDILAMVSRPDYDPNDFLPRLPPEMWQAIVESEHSPLRDRVYRQHTPPGSTFKVVTTLAAIDAGVFDPARTVNCPGYFNVGNMRYNLPREVSSPVAFHRAITKSFNTYFFDLGLLAGRSAMIETSHQWGLGSPSGFILPGELPGMIPNPESVRIAHRRNMGTGDVANMSIGQGDVLTTPLQMANLVAALANGGTLHRPRIVKQLENTAGEVIQSFPPQIIRQIPTHPYEYKLLIEGMIAVTVEGTGTRAQVPGVRVASKSGTAQVGSKSRPRQIAWFIGFLPANNPHYAFAVMIEGDHSQNLQGGDDAGKVAGNIFRTFYNNPAPIQTSNTSR